jgi:hypothetical protein
MKIVLCTLGILGLFAVVAHGQNQKPRVIFSPPSFYKAEAFVELNEADRQMYTTGLMGGFYASAFWGASDEAVANLTSCTKDMDSKQITAIITKYVNDHPEDWHLPLSTQAFNALNKACPGVLRVVPQKY